MALASFGKRKAGCSIDYGHQIDGNHCKGQFPAGKARWSDGDSVQRYKLMQNITKCEKQGENATEMQEVKLLGVN